MVDFHVEPRGEGSYTLSGIMTFDTVPEIARQGIDMFAAADKVSLDMSGVTRIDSAGIAQLLGWVLAARQQGRQIMFRNMPSQVMSLVKVSGLEEILAIAAA